MESFVNQPADEAAQHWLAVSRTKPVSLTRAKAGFVVAALAQAVRCVSLNHAMIGSGRRGEDWDAIGVLDDAAHALTSIGMILARSPDDLEVELEPEIVVWARRALGQVIDKLSSGAWDLKPMTVDVAGFVATMEGDFAMLD